MRSRLSSVSRFERRLTGIYRAYGLGQSGSGVSHNSKVLSNILFMVGNTGQAMAEALSKASAGFFLLRLVFERWQKILIVATSVVFAALCVGRL